MTFRKTISAITSLISVTTLSIASIATATDLTSEQQVREYFLGTSNTETAFGKGNSSNGTDYNSCTDQRNNGVPGDKISRITTWSNNTNYLKGIKVEYASGNSYLYGKQQSTSGVSYDFDPDEYIVKAQIWRGNQTNAPTRLRVWTEKLDSSATGQEYTFGSNNATKSSNTIEVDDHLTHISGSKAITGFYGTADSDRLWNLSVCMQPVAKLTFSDITLIDDELELQPDDLDVLYSFGVFTNSTSGTVHFTTSTTHRESVGITDTVSSTDTTSFATSLSFETTTKAGFLGTGTAGKWTLSGTLTTAVSDTVGQSNSNTVSQDFGSNTRIEAEPWGIYTAKTIVRAARATMPYYHHFTNEYDDTVVFKLRGELEDVAVSNTSVTVVKIGTIDSTTHEPTIDTLYSDKYMVVDGVVIAKTGNVVYDTDYEED